VLAQEAFEVVGVVVGEMPHGGPMRAGDRAAVVDGLVSPRVQEDGAVTGEDRDDRGVDVGERLQQQGIGGAEQLGEHQTWS
jgi:hypothetical protein